MGATPTSLGLQDFCEWQCDGSPIAIGTTIGEAIHRALFAYESLGPPFEPPAGPPLQGNFTHFFAAPLLGEL